jgi:hypothetical protein
MQSKQFDPNWPFPQYDEEGNILWYPKEEKPVKDIYPGDVEDSLL